MGYFINPELKRSTRILLVLNIMLLLMTIWILKINNDNLKRGYVRSLGAVVAKIDEKNPGLEKYVIPLMTKEVSDSEAKKGEEILKQYGLEDNLENGLFPYVKDAAYENNCAIICIFIISTIFYLILNYIQCGYFYRRIRALTGAAKQVVDGKYDMCIDEDKEGDFAKLALSFNSMREIIRNNIYELKKEKQFLVDILSDISHQLKTPLSSMIIYNDILLNKELTKEQKNTFLINNKNQLYKMNWLIKSILRLARIDANAIEFSMENKNLRETVEDSIEALNGKAQEDGISVNLKCNGEVYLLHDSSWLQEALINVIKNGIEHSKKGGKINVEISKNPIYTRIVIEDNGEGISEHDLPNIFKRFYRAKGSKKSESVGIGLALSKSIIEANGGMIEAQSKVNYGTKFIITFIRNGSEGI
jgi:signal transduction histidine kinase